MRVLSEIGVFHFSLIYASFVHVFPALAHKERVHKKVSKKVMIERDNYEYVLQVFDEGLYPR